MKNKCKKVCTWLTQVSKKADPVLWISLLFALFLLILVILPCFGNEHLYTSIVQKYLNFFHFVEKMNSGTPTNDVNYGMNGDSFGVINPFIALLAAVLTFIAFWTQYQANKRMLKDNEKQQMERQFYEMLRIHQENVDKLRIRILDIGKCDAEHSPISDAEGHEVFRILRYEFNYIFLKVFEIIRDNKNSAFEIAYRIFFWGKQIEQPGELQERINGMDQGFMPATEIGKGRIHLLDHYYRHLYYMVKSVACSKFYSEKDKIRLLKILRAQMTSDEQILLLYNWHAGLGKKWENSEYKQFFFSKYQMIHNIFPSNSIFNKNEILDMFPDVPEDEKKEMFENF